MKNTKFASMRRSFLVAVMTALAVLTCSSAALAFGSIRFKQTRIEEDDGRWKLDMDVDYGGTPIMPHIPFDFVFELKTYYEYSIQDGDKEPVIRPKPQREQQPTRLSLDIDFSDARGRVWPRTKFSISIRRKDDFEAGEYRLVVRRASDGAQLGQPVTLILNGKNQLVDRRTMIMPEAGHHKKPADSSSADKPKDDAADKPKNDAADKPKNDAAASKEGAESTEGAGKPGDDTGDKPGDGDESQPGTVNVRPGGHGCGCQTPRSQAPVGFGIVGLVAAAILALRTRRRTR